jgi:glycosyltransferase involved in cell wall biosynthesis
LPLRILHVSYIYPPTPKVADGVTNVVYSITGELAKIGHQVTVYTSNMLNLHSQDSLKAHNLIINGVNVHYSRTLWRHKTFMVTPSIVPLLSRNLANFDVVHVHDSRSFQGISAYLLAKAKDVPCVFQPHASYLSSLPDSFSEKIARLLLDKLISDRILENASRIIALNQSEANEYRNVGVPEEKIEIVPNGIDVSDFGVLPPLGSFKKRFNILENKRIILYLGRIHKTKRIDLLIKAYAYMIKNMGSNDSVLAIAGPDDGYLVEAKSLANSLGISDSVLFTGFLDIEDRLEALVDADLFVTPSFYGFPMTFLEACAVGTPILTTTLGDRLDWIDGNVGYVASPRPDDLAKAIYSIVSDDHLRQVFSGKCKQLVKSEFSLRKVAGRLECIYQALAQN